MPSHTLLTAESVLKLLKPPRMSGNSGLAQGRVGQAGRAALYLGCGTVTGKQARASSRQRVGGSSNGWAQYLRCCTANTNWTVSCSAALGVVTAFLALFWTKLLQCCGSVTLSVGQSSGSVQQELGWPPGCSHSGRRQILFQPGWSCWQSAQHTVPTGLSWWHPGGSRSAVPSPTHSTHQALHREKHILLFC